MMMVVFGFCGEARKLPRRDHDSKVGSGTCADMKCRSGPFCHNGCPIGYACGFSGKPGKCCKPVCLPLLRKKG